MNDLERVKSWLSHGDEVEQELAADVVAHLKKDAEIREAVRAAYDDPCVDLCGHGLVLRQLIEEKP